MDHHNEITHWKEVNLFGVKRIGFPEWQCVFAAVLGGIICFTFGLLLEMFYLYGSHEQATGSTGLLDLIESNAVLHAYYNFVAWLLPWAMMIGSFTLYRKYAPLRNLFWTFLLLTVHHPSETQVVGNVNAWVWLSFPTILSMIGMWGFASGTIKSFKDLYRRVSRRNIEPCSGSLKRP